MRRRSVLSIGFTAFVAITTVAAGLGVMILAAGGETGQLRLAPTVFAAGQKPDRVLYPVKVMPAPGGRPVPGDWRVLEPVRYENLLVFPVVTAIAADTSGFATLDEALASGDVVVAESGSALLRTRDGRPIPVRGSAQVNQLVLVNRGKRPVVLLAGEVVSGGKQDRVIGKDRIVAPGADPLPLDVFCVERGRWSGASAQFSESKFMAHPSVREKAVVDKAQDQVWAAVRSGSTSAQASAVVVEGGAAAGAPASAPVANARLSRGAVSEMAVESRSEAYGKIYGSRRVQQSVEHFAEEVARRFQRATSGLKGERVVGVVIAYNGEVAWSDIFASDTLFDRYWPKLLRSYVVEALARPLIREAATLDDARGFLAPLAGHETIESEPGVYRWRETSSGHYAQIELDSLLGRTFTLHRVKIHRTS
jgi:hypothetical protein